MWSKFYVKIDSTFLKMLQTTCRETLADYGSLIEKNKHNLFDLTPNKRHSVFVLHCTMLSCSRPDMFSIFSIFSTWYQNSIDNETTAYDWEISPLVRSHSTVRVNCVLALPGSDSFGSYHLSIAMQFISEFISVNVRLNWPESFVSYELLIQTEVTKNALIWKLFVL